MKLLLKIILLMGFYLFNTFVLFRSFHNSIVAEKRATRSNRNVAITTRRIPAKPPSLGEEEEEKKGKWLKNHPSLRLPRVLAIIFPQFHRDPLNDKLWGDGFTDWDNLRAAPVQNRLGFDIPRPLTSELGYYDLTNTTVRKRQGDLAHQYGIDGFVYHHYWFYDKSHPGPNLHQPLMEMLQDGQPDVPFFFNWCGTKWVDTWSGKVKQNSTTNDNNNNVLQKQVFPDPDDPSVQMHYDWLKQFFQHDNYIKVQGQPVLMLYQKKPRAMPILQRFRELAKADGFPNLYILVGMSKTHDDLFPEGKHEGQRFNRFPPNLVNRTVAYPNPMNITSKQVLKVPQWCFLKDAKNNKKKPGFQVAGILTSFDNTPRRDFETATLWSADEPRVVVNRFHQSLHAAIYYETCCVSSFAYKNNVETSVVGSDSNTDNKKNVVVDGDERFILINSMNEWAEGMALEPSNVFGYEFLQAVWDAKSNVANSGCNAQLFMNDDKDKR